MLTKVSVQVYLPTTPTDINTWSAQLVLQLTQLFTQYGTRLNAVLPEDGSEAMTGPLTQPFYAFAHLPTPSRGMRLFVSDSNTNTFNATITSGGGGDFVPAFYDGTNWRVG